MKQIFVWILGLLLPLAVYSADEQLRLPSGDLVAPKIKHAPILKGLGIDEEIKIEAIVTDNVAVSSVILFYRNIGATDYQRIKMVRELGKDKYKAVIKNALKPGLEYYIQASDPAGNTILHGHSFSPLVVKVTAPKSEKDKVTKNMGESSPSDLKKIPGKTPFYTNKWFLIGAGVLVGGVAIASGGGSDDGGGEATITITAPTP